MSSRDNPSKKPSRFNRTALSISVALAMGAGASALVHAQAPARPTTPELNSAAIRNYSVPGGALDAVLKNFASQAGITLSAPSELTKGKTSSGLNGEYSVRDALQTLLAGSGLVAQFDGNNRVTLVKGQQDQAKTLAPVRVVAGGYELRPTPQEIGYWSKESSASGFRSKPVLDTPSSVVSFPAELFRDQQVRNLTEVTENDPSVIAGGPSEWYDRVMVRGFYLSTDAVMRDGLSINDQGSIALENKAAVEINKGLSALRYGVTSPGGVINYVMKRPTDEPLARIVVSGDQHGSLGAHADFGGRFGDDEEFGVRVNAANKESQNQWDNYQHDTKFFSTFFDWRATDDLLIELEHEHQKKTETEFDIPSLWWFYNDNKSADQITEDARAYFPQLDAETAVVAPWAKVPNEQNYYAGRLHYQLMDTWKVRYSHQRSELFRHQFSPGVADLQADGSYQVSLYYSPNQERNNIAQQLVFEGDVETFGIGHELAFGYDEVRRDMTWGNSEVPELGAGNITAGGSDIARPDFAALLAGRTELTNRTDQISFFLTDTLSLNEQFEIFAGVRHTAIEQYQPSDGRLAKVYDSSATNPTLGLVYKPRQNLTFYTSYSEGIEQGSFVPRDAIPPYTNEGVTLKPLESQQLEVGAKWELGSDALLTAAVFEIDKGLELDLNNGTTLTRVQDGRQVHRGIEATFSGQATDELRVIAGIAYLDAEIEKTQDTSLIGKTPAGVPELQANFYADYSLAAFVEGLSVNAGVFYGGKKAIDDLNIWTADSYFRIDVGARYEQLWGDGNKVTYRLNIENLSDEEYLANTTWNSLNFGDPRTAKASIQFDF